MSLSNAWLTKRGDLRPGHQRSTKRGYVCTYLGYRVKKGLGILPVKVPDHLSLVEVGEDFHHQRGTLVRSECTADQLLPGWAFSADEKAKLTNV